jgi:lysophospholipase L1-like esterase
MIHILLALASLSAAQELSLSACDSGSPASAGGGATVAATTADKKEGDASFQVTLAQTPANAPYVRISAAAAWTSYSGIRFWVKRTSGTEGGAALQLLWTRHYASFPLTDTWTEVTLRWQDFTQRLYAGSCENLLGSVDTLEFTLAPGETRDGGSRGPLGFLVDDIRLVPGLSPLTTPLPAAADLPITRARLAAIQPVKVVCLGTSITYGHVNGGGRLSDPWPSALQAKLRADLGTSAITVLNYGVRGAKSWQGAAALHDFVVREQPQLVLVEYLANDYADAEPANGVSAYRDNMERLFDLLLRWGQADVGVVLPNPYGEAGNTRKYDTYVANLTAAANARKLWVIDVYSAFLGLSEATLLSYCDSSPTRLPAPRRCRTAPATPCRARPCGRCRSRSHRARNECRTPACAVRHRTRERRRRRARKAPAPAPRRRRSGWCWFGAARRKRRPPHPSSSRCRPLATARPRALPRSSVSGRPSAAASRAR